MIKDRILTGLRANGEFHIGNYLGAILPVVGQQKKHAGKYQINMFIPDLHSFTTPIDHSKLYEQSIANIKVYVAAGLDIQNPDTYVYRQSYVPAHSELAWILQCFTGYGELKRMTQFKDKAGQITEDQDSDEVELPTENSISAGLLSYPVLMAADILLYNAKYVPVGEDQRQHLELARDLGIRLNNKFGSDLFVVPADWKTQLEFAGLDNGVRIRSLRNPDKKMSKSVNDPSGTIMLSDKPSDAAQKILRAETDSLGSIAYDFDTSPGVSNLLQILALLSEQPKEEVNAQWIGKSSYQSLKSEVAAKVEEFLLNLQSSLDGVDEAKLIQKLESDEEKMRVVSGETLYKVQQAVGLRPR